MLDLVLEIPDQLRWGSALVVEPVPAPRNVVVTGMGGSGIAGDAARLLASDANRRIVVHKGYGLPPGCEPGDLLVAVSHSGNTEETLAAVDAGVDAGLSIVAVATGGRLAALGAEQGFPVVIIPPGPQPRAAFGYLTAAVLRLLEEASVLSGVRDALIEAATVVSEIFEGDGPELAESIAQTVTGRYAVVFGGDGVGSVAAGRWKTQINENAKSPAAVEVLPEADHNAIVGWMADPEFVRSSIAAVFLTDAGDHPRVALRSRLTMDVASEHMPVVGPVVSRGESTIARLFSLAVIGDLVSVELARLLDVDPMPVTVLQELKQRLAEEPS